MIYDISLPISESLVVWPGDPPVRITQPSHLARGDNATLSRMDIGTHTGTHVDAPAHFFAGGSGVDQLDLGVLVGPALVVEALEPDVLSEEVLELLDIPVGTERVLFHTRNSKLWAQARPDFDSGFVAITEDGAQWLISRGIRLVGIDYLSVAPYDTTAPTHRAFLRAGVVILEGLDLGDIAPGTYQLVCLPLKIVGADGAPARAILIEPARAGF
jgi:arylformamidase